MSYVCAFTCCGIEFDVYNTDRIIPEKTGRKYFITPNGIMEAEKFIIKNDILKVDTSEQMSYLIENGIIKEY